MISDAGSTEREGVWTIVVAAGSGTRFGAPKQFTELDGSRVVDRSVAEAAVHSEGVVVVMPPNPVANDHAPEVADGVELQFASGGDTRSESVRRGLAMVAETAEVVLVHDAARPLASAATYRAAIAEVRTGADGAVPVVPLTDTIRQRDGGSVDRDQLVAVQTPQAFRAEMLRLAHANSDEATDDATLVEAAGGRVVFVDGENGNIKITSPDDLALAAALLRRSGAADG